MGPAVELVDALLLLVDLVFLPIYATNVRFSPFQVWPGGMEDEEEDKLQLRAQKPPAPGPQEEDDGGANSSSSEEMEE